MNLTALVAVHIVVGHYSPNTYVLNLLQRQVCIDGGQ